MLRAPILFISLLASATFVASAPLDNVVLGGDGHGRLKTDEPPTMPDVLGGDDHGMLKPPILGGDGHGMLETDDAQTMASPVLGGDDHGIFNPPVLGGDDHGMNNPPVLGGDGHGMIETDSAPTMPTTLLGGDGHGVFNPVLGEADGDQQEVHLHQSEFTAEVPESSERTQPAPTPDDTIGGDDHGQLTPVSENVAGEFRLHQSEYASNDANEVNLDSIEMLDERNSSNPVFDWSVTHYLNGSVCYADGVGDGHDNKCYSEWWYRLTVMTTHFFAFLMVVTIAIQAVVITRRNRDLKAVSLQMASILADTQPNGNLHGGDADTVSLLVPPAYPIINVSKLGGESRNVQSEA
jgi:hypothetical protein